MMVSKYGYSMPPGACQGKVAADIDFTDKAVVHWDVPVVKILLSKL